MELIGATIFFALVFAGGFLSGYGARARISHRRRARARERFVYPA